ncbi:MAG: hypothetical protein ACUVXB_16910 [Bryobacteraceae bacterium]
MKRYLLGLLVVAGLLPSQTRVDLGRQGKRPDFTTMQETRPVQAGPELPAACSVGQLFFKTGAGGAQSLYACVADSQWETTSGLRGCSVDENNNLTCPGDLLSGDASKPGEIALYELPPNGSDFVSWLAPESIPVSYRLRLPAEQPSPGQVLAFASPSGGIAQGSWLTPAGSGSQPAVNPSFILLVDEFLPTPSLVGNGAFGQLGWQATASGVNYLGTSAGNPWPGLIEISTNGVSNQLFGIHLAGYAFSYPWLWNAAQQAGWEFQFAFKSDVYFTTQHITRLGLVNSLDQDPSEGIWARVVNNTSCTLNGNDTTWKLEAKSSGGGTVTVDSGISYATDTYYRIRVRSLQAGQALWSFSVNGGSFSSEVALNFGSVAALAPVFELWGCDGQNHRIVVDRFDAVVQR